MMGPKKQITEKDMQSIDFTVGEEPPDDIE